MSDAQRAGISKRTYVILGVTGAVALAAVIVALILLLSPREAEAVPSSSPTSAVSAEQLEDLSVALQSEDRETLAAALAMPAADVTDDIADGFASTDIIWDADAAKGVEDAERQVVAWRVPAEVTEADGTTSTWLVTLVPGPDGLVFFDSEEVQR